MKEYTDNVRFTFTVSQYSRKNIAAINRLQLEQRSVKLGIEEIEETIQVIDKCTTHITSMQLRLVLMVQTRTRIFGA